MQNVCIYTHLILPIYTYKSGEWGSSWQSARLLFFSPGSAVLNLWYLFYPCATAVAHKRSWSFCQKRRWQDVAQHLYTLSMWLWIKWHCKLVHDVHRMCAQTVALSYGASHVPRMCAETAALSCGASHVTTKQHCKYTTLVDIQKSVLQIATVTHWESHTTRVHRVSRANNCYIKAVNNNITCLHTNTHAYIDTSASIWDPTALKKKKKNVIPI